MKRRIKIFLSWLKGRKLHRARVKARYIYIYKEKENFLKQHDMSKGSRRKKKRNYKAVAFYYINNVYKNPVARFIMRMRYRIGNPYIKLPLFIDFFRWIIYDFFCGKGMKFFGIYCFVALPGEGKTLGMTYHIEQQRRKHKKEKIFVATNYNYKHQDAAINDWIDIIRWSKYCYQNHMKCIIAMDEIHLSFDKTEWKNFPPELLAVMSFNRKYKLQFLCSAQRYDRIPVKIAGIANYIIICKNIWHQDRMFINYYFKMADYESSFSGKRKKADYIQPYVASNRLYALYDTTAQVNRMVDDSKKEKEKREQALDILFGEFKQREENERTLQPEAAKTEEAKA